MKLSFKDKELSPRVSVGAAAFGSGRAFVSVAGTKLEAPTFHVDLGINGFAC